CTGCELCLPPCPVDCIEMRPAPTGAVNDPPLNRSRFAAHTARLRRRDEERRRAIAAKKALVPR
ncbi:MAG: electron transporter RnfB, partial [Gammaproteobacteria bacterium]|nr:electron transporter RnfB [Gammaproteobacteria bacterium]